MAYRRDLDERVRIAADRADRARRDYEELLRIKKAEEVRKRNAVQRRGKYALRKLNQGRMKLGLCACGCSGWVYPPAAIVEVPDGPNLIYKPECKKLLNDTHNS